MFTLRGARARLGRITLSLALAAASLSITGIGLASPADAAGAPLSCDGGTIYSYQRGTTGSDRTTTGSVYALNTSTVGGATVAATLVTRVPSGGFANALGITKGGTAMYAVNQSTSARNSAVIHGYNTSTQRWTQCHVEERVGLRGADAGGAGARPQSVTPCDYPARSGVVVALGCRGGCTRHARLMRA